MGPLGFERLLGQRGETSPGDGSPDCNSHLLQHDQEHAGPQRGAVLASCHRLQRLVKPTSNQREHWPEQSFGQDIPLFRVYGDSYTAFRTMRVGYDDLLR